MILELSEDTAALLLALDRILPNYRLLLHTIIRLFWEDFITVTWPRLWPLSAFSFDTFSPASSQAFLLDNLGSGHVQTDFSGGSLSCDAGLLLPRQIDSHRGLTAALAQRLEDHRNQAWVDHSLCSARPR